MGREVRRVPQNWSHPRNEHGHLQPMHNESFPERFAEWLAEFDRIRRGELTNFERECYASDNPLAEWLVDEGTPPDPAYYRPWSDDDATWFQVWEAVSEGTPVSPPFATPKELVDYLVEHGDEWDQRRGNGGYSRAAAEAFVASGWVPTMVIQSGPSGQKIMMGIGAAEALKDKP